MQLLRGLHSLQPLIGGCVATIGNFDGVHLGHQAILACLRGRSLELDIPNCAVIFKPQSRELFSFGLALVRLARLHEKLGLLCRQGVDAVLCLVFDRRLRELSAIGFTCQVLVDGLAVQHPEVGDDFRFGCDRSGDFAFLVNTSREQGFTVEAAAAVELDGTRVSGMWVRQALIEGDLHLAERLLRCPFSLSGRVLYGQKLGRQLGSSTTNIQLKRHKAPLNEVCLVSTPVGGQRYQGVVNVGTRSPVNGSGRLHLEAHLLDFVGDLYGRHLQVASHQKLCDEQRSVSLEALKATTLADITAARAY